MVFGMSFQESEEQKTSLGIAASVICFITGWGIGLKVIRKTKGEEGKARAVGGVVESEDDGNLAV
jgi:hypothetical protein